MLTTYLTSEDITFHTETTDEIIEQYLLRIAVNDKSALSALYRATSTNIYSYALSVLKNSQDAEDILQECFVRIYLNASNYQPQKKPLAWMITITRNLCLQHIRDHKRFTDLPEEDWEPYLSSQTGLLEEDRIILSECMRELGDTERQIVVLHAISGFKHREIATLLHLPLPTVLSKYNRALKKLQVVLQKGEN